MKRIFVRALFVSFALSPVSAGHMAMAGTGTTEISELPISTLSGDTFTLKDYRGKQPVYLKFWATWCQPCRKEMPHLQRTYEKFGKEVKIVAINIDINENRKAIEDTRREFGLTLPIALDDSGSLSKAFNMIGTPYHVLIDKAGNIVHQGHKASKELDDKISLLSADRPLADVTNDSSQQAAIPGPVVEKATDGPSALFFNSTWCDWYLEKSRPAMSANCISAQNQINALHENSPQTNWRGIVSRLWTGNEELEAYRAKYQIKYPLILDVSGDIFLDYEVRSLPTLILFRNGKEVARETNFDDPAAVTRVIKRYLE